VVDLQLYYELEAAPGAGLHQDQEVEFDADEVVVSVTGCSRLEADCMLAGNLLGVRMARWVAQVLKGHKDRKVDWAGSEHLGEQLPRKARKDM